MLTDPNAAWRDLSEAVERENWDLAAEVAGELCVWLERGAFPPSITGKMRFDRLIAKKVSEAIVAWEVF